MPKTSGKPHIPLLPAQRIKAAAVLCLLRTVAPPRLANDRAGYRKYAPLPDWYIFATFAGIFPIMNCLLATATAKEIAPFLRHYRTSDNPANMDILVTGIGLTTATYSLTRQIHIKRPDVIVQAGISGCFDKNIPLGSVVVIKQDAFADVGVMESNKLKTVFDMGLVKYNQFPFRRGVLVNPHKFLLRQSGLKGVNAVSVNHITTGKKMAELYQFKFQPVIESMEGAALHYVCLRERIPFIQVRSISNYIGERNKSKWNLRDAVFNLNNEIIRLANRMTTSSTQTFNSRP